MRQSGCPQSHTIEHEYTHCLCLLLLLLAIAAQSRSISTSFDSPFQPSPSLSRSQLRSLFHGSLFHFSAMLSFASSSCRPFPFRWRVWRVHSGGGGYGLDTSVNRVLHVSSYMLRTHTHTHTHTHNRVDNTCTHRRAHTHTHTPVCVCVFVSAHDFSLTPNSDCVKRDLRVSKRALLKTHQTQKPEQRPMCDKRDQFKQRQACFRKEACAKPESIRLHFSLLHFTTIQHHRTLLHISISANVSTKAHMIALWNCDHTSVKRGLYVSKEASMRL